MIPDYLKKWLLIGATIIPIAFKSKLPLLKSWLEYQNKQNTEQEIETWIAQYGGCNWALVTGRITVIDFDTFGAFGNWLNWAMGNNEESSLVAQYSLKTVTSRGVHVYVSVDQPARGFKQPAIDVKALGGYVLIPPSIHPDGTEYKYLIDDAPIIQVSSPSKLLADTEQPTPKDPWQQVSSTTANINGHGLIANIRRSVSILGFLDGVEKSGSGRWYKAWCPFHPDKSNGHSKSLWVDTERGIAGCFACGGKPLDVINVYARLNNLSNNEAIFRLGEYLK